MSCFDMVSDEIYNERAERYRLAALDLGDMLGEGINKNLKRKHLFHNQEEEIKEYGHYPFAVYLRRNDSLVASIKCWEEEHDLRPRLELDLNPRYMDEAKSAAMLHYKKHNKGFIYHVGDVIIPRGSFGVILVPTGKTTHEYGLKRAREQGIPIISLRNPGKPVRV